MPEPSSGGWVSEHWESAITGIAALGMLAREVWRMREERAKSLREAVKDQRDEGEGIFQRALTLLRETEERYRRSETQLEAARAETERLQAVADGLAQQIGGRRTRFNLHLWNSSGPRLVEVEMTPEEFARAITGEVVSCVVDLRLDRIASMDQVSTADATANEIPPGR